MFRSLTSRLSVRGFVEHLVYGVFWLGVLARSHQFDTFCLDFCRLCMEMYCCEDYNALSKLSYGYHQACF